MHTDESKRYDKRNIDSNLRKGEVTPRDYEAYLSRLPDVSEKAFEPDEEASPGGEEGAGVKGGHPGTSRKGATSSRRG